MNNLSVSQAINKAIIEDEKLRKNKYKNQLILRVQSLTGRPIKFTTVDRYQRFIVPRNQR